jgi:hypothetical protein
MLKIFNYIIKKRPNISILFIFTLFLSSFLIGIIYRFYNINIIEYIILSPNNLFEPINWYRFITHIFYLDNNFLRVIIIIILSGYIIENRTKKINILIIFIISTLFGGLTFCITNNNYLDSKFGSAYIVSLGIMSSAIIYALQNWKKSNLFEKIFSIFGLLNIIAMFFGIMYSMFFEKLVVALISILLTNILKFYKKENNENEEANQHTTAQGSKGSLC